MNDCTNNRPNMNRKAFLKVAGQGAAAVAALSAGAPAVLAGGSPNENVNLGHIGIGVRGGTLLKQVAGTPARKGIPGTKVVAVCDVYKPHLEKAVAHSFNPSVRAYENYEDLLADEGVDAVVVAVPDHWHSKILIDACKAGKDVYIEKGWTRTIAEAKAMRKAVKDSGIVMQLGHQGRQSAAVIQARQLIAGGALGPVTLVRTGRLMNREASRPIWRWYGWYDNYDRPDPKKVVENLNWPKWLGPVSDRPFKMEHFWHWRCYWDYGTGVAGDLLSHEMDFVQAVMGHGIPDSCVCSGQITLLDDGREVPDTWNTIYEWKEGNGHPPHACTFATTMNTASPPQYPEFRGKDAYLVCNGIAQDVNAATGEMSVGEPFMQFDPAKTPEQPSHMEDFINSVRERKQPKCNVDEAFVEAATLIMSVEAWKQQRTAKWDEEKEEIV